MFYASYEENGKKVGHLFESYADFLKEVGTASPIDIVDFKTTGRSYSEKKESVRKVAQEFQSVECGGMYMSEYADVSGWFRLMGERYGLSAEFEREGVI